MVHFVPSRGHLASHPLFYSLLRCGEGGIRSQINFLTEIFRYPVSRCSPWTKVQTHTSLRHSHPSRNTNNCVALLPCFPAEKEGFEPSVHFHKQCFSRAPHSTTLAPLHIYLYIDITLILPCCLQKPLIN